MGQLVNGVEKFVGKSYKNVAVFGGSFNPITNSHISTLQKCSERKGLDCIVIEPVGDMYDKPGLKSYKERVEIIKRALWEVIKELDADILIGDFENDQLGQPTTFMTLNHYQEIFPNAKMHFICGADVLASMEGWGGDVANLVNTYDIICMDRAEEGKNIEYDIINNSPMLYKRRDHIHIESMMTYNFISSTLIRNRVMCNQSLVTLVPTSTIPLINNIYRPKNQMNVRTEGYIIIRDPERKFIDGGRIMAVEESLVKGAMAPRVIYRGLEVDLDADLDLYDCLYVPCDIFQDFEDILRAEYMLAVEAMNGALTKEAFEANRADIRESLNDLFEETIGKIDCQYEKRKIVDNLATYKSKSVDNLPF